MSLSGCNMAFSIFNQSGADELDELKKKVK